jgi:lipopolysaccharide transport system ATP-binding protein
MSDIVIRAENLSKRYRIGERQPYLALRDVLARTVSAPARLFQARKSGSPNGDPAHIWALKDVSFEVHQGDVVGIIGRNGAGKTTLLKILARVTKPTCGFAQVRGRMGTLLEVGTGFHPELTGRENTYLSGAILGMRKREIERKFDEIVAFAEIEKFIDTPVKHYSSGMFVRLAFAVAAHLEPEILIVDEVLAVGDAAFQKKSLGKMTDVARQGRTVIFVSHNMGAVTNLCGSGLVLEKGGIAFRGDARDAVDFYNRAMFASEEATGRPPHVLYDAPENAAQHDFAITRVEMLDTAGNPKPTLSTWDDVVIRFWYHSKRALQRGSVVLELMGLDGSPLLLLSTQPDSVLPLPFQVGTSYVDCLLEKIPFAAGDYILGGALAIPCSEWLWRDRALARVTVLPRDVFGSGLAPHTGRALIAVDHTWRVAR